jgi:glutathione S-transferase
MRIGIDVELYFSPLACSLASRIAVYEAGIEREVAFHDVTLATKRCGDGRDFFGVSAKGQVPALITREGRLLTENAAVLQYLADLAPDAGLAPPPASDARYELQSWLSFVATELHKLAFAVFFDPTAPAEAKAFAVGEKLPKRLGFLDAALARTGPFLLGEAFTVADCYLAVALLWCRPAEVDLTRFPAILGYYKRAHARPQVARAVREELVLSGREVAESPASTA